MVGAWGTDGLLMMATSAECLILGEGATTLLQLIVVPISRFAPRSTITTTFM